VAILLSRRAAVIAIIAFFAAIVVLNRWLGPLPQPLAFWCDPLILEFCFGMLIALAYRAGLMLPRLAAWALIAAGIVGYGAFGLSIANVPWRVLVWGLPAAAVVSGLTLGGNLAPRGIAGRALAALGDASYSLYLVHPFAISAARRFLPVLVDPRAMPWLDMLLFLLVATAAAVATYRLFERPVTKMLQNGIAGVRGHARPEPSQAAREGDPARVPAQP